MELEIILKLKQQMELNLRKHNQNIYKNYNVPQCYTLWTIKHMLYSKKNHLASTFDNTVLNNLTITCTDRPLRLHVIYNITATGNRKGIIYN